MHYAWGCLCGGTLKLGVKNLAANAGNKETKVQSLGQQDLLKEGMATPSSILAWRIPGTEEPGGLPSMGSHRVGQDWSNLAAAAAADGKESACNAGDPGSIPGSESHGLHVRLFVTPCTAALQAPPSMGFSRQGYWSGLPFPSPEDLPDPGIEPRSPALQAEALPSEPPGKHRV